MSVTIKKECSCLRKVSLKNKHGALNLKLRASLSHLSIKANYFEYLEP